MRKCTKDLAPYPARSKHTHLPHVKCYYLYHIVFTSINSTNQLLQRSTIWKAQIISGVSIFSFLPLV